MPEFHTERGRNEAFFGGDFLNNQTTRDRPVSFVLLVILAAVNFAAYLLNGGFEHTHTDELLVVPMVYLTIKVLCTDQIRFLPEMIFVVGAAAQGLQYLTECGIPADSMNFSDIMTQAAPYRKAVLYYLAGLAGLRGGRVLFRRLRHSYGQKSRRDRRLMLTKLACVLLACAMAAVYMVWEDNAIVVSRYTYQSDKISPSLDGYKIVQVSDLHNKCFGQSSVFLLQKIQAEQPDLIVVTGDLVDRNRTDLGVALDFVERAAAIAPLFYVTGNHEDALSESQLRELLDGITQAGGTVLDSEYVTVSRSRGVVEYGDDTHHTVLQGAPNDTFRLIGLANQNLFRSKLHYLTPASDDLHILLAHQPQAIDHYAAEDIDIVFAGHAHGGQFRLPLIGAVYAPGQGLLPQYTEGMYQYGQTSMVVSRGLGNSVFPIRINNRPELVVVELIRN